MVNVNRILSLILIPCLILQGGGCRTALESPPPHGDPFLGAMTRVEYPDADTCPVPDNAQPSLPPTVRSPGDFERWPMTLEEAVRLALSNSKILRDLGGQVVQTPQATRTQYDPALQELNPLSGVNAALSAFDAQMSTTLFLDKDDRAFNNAFFSGGAAGALQQDSGTIRGEISKRAPTGTRIALRNINDYVGNNVPQPPNLFPSAWESTWEGEVRHPLMRGAGIDVNRIAGPDALPGQYNGVLIARINTDTVITDFEVGVRNLTRDVERAYWELYFAYRDLDARTQGLDFALKTWKLVQDRINVGTSDSEREALARSQYYQTKSLVEDAFAGRPGSPSGLLNAERRLRFLLALPAADGRLILPADEPAKVNIKFDWNEITNEALFRRAELRRQQWQIRRRELEVVAARNQTLPQVNFIGQYRWRGLGNDLFGSSDMPLGSATQELLSGDLQGWRVGLEVLNPVGNRQGHLAVRHAQFQLARERAILEAQQQRVAHEVAQAFAELDRAYALTRTKFNESAATFEQAVAISNKYLLGPEQPDVLLENVLGAQSRAVQATSDYFRSLVDYNLAVMELHFSKGTLLDHHAVQLAEGPWSQAARIESGRNTEHVVPTQAPKRVDVNPVTRGAYPQTTLPTANAPATEGELLAPAAEFPATAPAPPSPEPTAGATDGASNGRESGRVAARLASMNSLAPWKWLGPRDPRESSSRESTEGPAIVDSTPIQ